MRLLLLFLALCFASCSSTPFCSGSTCTGCCKDDVCLNGTLSATCGHDGAACTACPTNQFCGTDGMCATDTSGVCSANNCNGCCISASNNCAPGDGPNSCGKGGAACQICASSQSCVSGECH